jgi:phospholipase/carboxylesterase
LSLKYIQIPPTNGQPPTHLMICLHGWGANLHDLAPLAEAMNLPNFQFLFPDAPFPHPHVPGGKMWYDLESQNYQGLEESRQMLIDWLNSLEDTTGIGRSQTILSGFSQGGAMTLDVGVALPLAGLVSMSGYLHSKLQPIPKESLPLISILHGKHDPIVPIAAAQKARDTLTALGIDVKYQEFDMAHEIKPEVLTVVRNFVLDTVKYSPA